MGEIVDVRGPLHLHELQKLPPMALLERCRRHMIRQRSILWSCPFDIHDDGGREQAAMWLAQEVMGVLNDGSDV